MNEDRHRARPGLLVAAMAGGWLPFLFWQLGELADEAEHLHVAWLMGRLGLHPLDDFFQHHQPILWDVLGVFYRFGGDGPAVAYFGRFLVVVAASITLGCLARVAGRSGPDAAAAAVAVTAYWVVVNLLLPEGLVIRPETLGVAATAFAFALWTRDEQTASRGFVVDLLAGMAFGVALLSSLRFVLVAGFFALVHRRSGPLLELRALRHGALLAGAAVAWTAYLAATPHRLADLVFDVRFSAHLQSVGDGDPRVAVPLALIATASLVLHLLLASRLPRPARDRSLLGLAYLIATAVISFQSARGYLYAQVFVPTWLLSALLLAFGVAQLDPSSRGRGFRRLPAVLALVTLVLTLGLTVQRFARGLPLPGLVAWRAQLNRILPPGAEVLVPAGLHPIERRDASYYGPPLVDAEDRLCRAVRSFGSDLPPCDYSADLFRRPPEVTFPGLLGQVEPARRPEVARFLRQNYEATPPLLVRRDLLSPDARP